MAKIFSQLISAQAENKASDYSAGTIGRFWLNTATSLLKFDDGSAIRTAVTTDNSQVLTNKDIDGGTASNTSRITVPKASLATLTALTRKQATLVYASDVNKVYKDDGSSLTEIGSASGSINYIGNPDAEGGTTGWATYADSASNIPADGTGGTATNLTFSASSSSPLRGTQSFSMAQANSTSLQGKGVSYDFTISSADKAKPLGISFDYNASSTFVAGNGITAPLNDNTTSTNAGNSDVEVFLYDVTNAVLIPVSPQVITANGSNNFKFSGSFQTASNSTSYRLILHIATTSANATGWTFKFDNVVVGPNVQIIGAPVTDDTSYTPTFVGVGTVSNVSVFYKRIGDKLRVRGFCTLGTLAASTASITLPSGLAVDTTKISAGTNAQAVGTYMDISTGASAQITAAGQFGSVFYDGSTTGILYFARATASNQFTKINGNSLFSASNDGLSFEFEVPISGWGSTVTLSNDTDTRVVAATYAVSTNNAPGTNNQINFDTKVVDTHSAVTTGSSWKFTAPVSGIYQVSCTTTQGSATLYDSLLYKNGSALFQLTTTFNNGSAFASSVLVNLVAGDFIDVRIDAAGTITGNATYRSYISIQRLTGPATIAASETLAMGCYLNSNTAALSANAVIPFDTKIFDTHGIYSTSTGRATIPISGKYSVSIQMVGPTSAGAGPIFQVFKNGSAFSSIADLGTTNYVGGTILMNLLAGDIIDIRCDTAKTIVGGTLSTGRAGQFYVSRIGN